MLFEQMRHHKPGEAFLKLNELNLSFSHMRVLQQLVPDRMLSMKDIAAELHLAPPSLTTLVRRLEQTGLVSRQTHPEDSRVSLLSLTNEGRQLFQQLYQERLSGLDKLLSGLSEEEQELFISLFERAVETLKPEASSK